MGNDRINGISLDLSLTWARCAISLAFCLGVMSCTENFSSSRLIHRAPPAEPQLAETGNTSQPTGVVSISSPADYRIRPLDMLEITVFNEPDLCKKDVHVSAQGMINYPLLGAVRVGGLTVTEAEDMLKERLGRDYLVKPQVSVLVNRANSRRVFILGQVRSPGAIEFSSDERLTLLQAIARAGGFTPVAAPGRVSISRSSGEGGAEQIIVNVTAIISSGDRTKDPELQSDDVVSVPESIF